MKEYTISKEFMDMRLDRYISKMLPDFSKSTIQKLLRKKNIKVNGKKSEGNYRLLEGDIISFYLSDEYFSCNKKESKEIDLSKLDIIYESEMMLIINKPIGILSQPDGSKNANLVDMIGAYLSNNADSDNPAYGVVNRLDRNTSGLVIAGKTRRALMLLNKLNQEAGKIIKTYVTLVNGFLDIENKIVTNYAKKDKVDNKMIIFDNPADGLYKMQTCFNAISANQNYTLLAATLLTGRFHQIRSQLDYMGYPIVGDRKYSDNTHSSPPEKTKLEYQFLHAYKLSFKIDETLKELMPNKYDSHKEEVVFKAPLPAKLISLLEDINIRTPIL